MMYRDKEKQFSKGEMRYSVKGEMMYSDKEK